MFDRIKKLADEKKISLTELSIKMGWSNKAIYNWKATSPSVEKVKMVADYFGVTVDFLLNGTDKKESKEDSERSIQRDLDRLIEGLSGMSYSKDVEEMSDETKELLIASLEQAARIARLNASKE